MRRTTMLCGAAATVLLTAGSAQAGTLWIADMRGTNEVPPNSVPFTGTGFIVLDDAETAATVYADHNINITLTGGHVHRGARGVNGPIILPFPNPASPIGPVPWAIPGAEVANLKAGNLYINIHTTVHPGGSIRDQFRRFSFLPSAGNSAQAAVAGALDVSAAYTQDLDRVLMALAVAPDTTRAAALDQLSAYTVYAQGRQAVETMVDFEETLFSRAEAMAATPEAGTGAFIVGGDAFGSRDTEVGQAGSRISRPFVLGGIDFAVSPALRAGVGLGHAAGTDSFRRGVGETDATTTAVQAWLSATGAGVVFTAVAGYGWTEFDTSRGLGALNRVATSTHDGRVWSLGARVSAPMTMGGFDLSPYALVDAQRAKIDSYVESGAGAAGLVIPEREDQNAAIEAGAALAIPMGSGDAGMAARLRVGGRYLLDEGGDAFAASFAGSPVTFQTEMLSPGRAALRAEAMLNGNLANGLTWSAGYRGLVAERAKLHQVELRLTLRR